MRKIFGLLIVFLCIIVVYSGFNKASEREGKEGLQIDTYMLTIGGIDGASIDSMDQQQISYHFVITNDGMNILEDSVTVVLSDWLADRTLEEKITSKTINEDRILIKGFVIMDAHDLSKQDFDSKRLIVGINMKNDNDEEIMLYHR